MLFGLVRVSTKIVWGLVVCCLTGAFLKHAFVKCENYEWKFPLRRVLLMGFILPTLTLATFITVTVQMVCHLLWLLPYTQRLQMSQTVAGYFWDAVALALVHFPDVDYRIHVEGTSAEHKSAVEVVSKVWNSIHGRDVVVICNHELTEFDSLPMRVFLSRFGFAANSWGLVDKLFAYGSPLGCLLSLAGSIPVHRRANLDIAPLNKGLANGVRNYPQPWAFAYYPSAAMPTKRLLEASQQFARKQGLKPLKNVLQPRANEFVIIDRNLRPKVRYVVDLTVLHYPNEPHIWSFLETGKMHRSTDIYVRLYDATHLPHDDEELIEWLYKMWAEKDEIHTNLQRGKYPLTPLGNNPKRAGISFGAIVCFLTIALKVLTKTPPMLCFIWMATALFPLWVVFLQWNKKLLDSMEASKERCAAVAAAEHRVATDTELKQWAAWAYRQFWDLHKVAPSVADTVKGKAEESS